MSGEIEVRITPMVALVILASGGCRNFTGASTCRTADRHPLARYGADVWCEGCICAAALEEAERIGRPS